MRRILYAAALVAGGATVVGAAVNQLAAQTAAFPAQNSVAKTAPAAAAPAGAPVTFYSQSSDPFTVTTGGGYWTGQNMTPEAAARMREESTLEHQAGDLVRKYGAAEDTAKKDEIRKQLNEVLSKQFQLQQTRREEEVKEVEKKLQKLKELITKRNDQKTKIIENRLDQILRDAEGLGWNSGGNSVRAFSYPSAVPMVAPPRNANNLAPAASSGTGTSTSASSGSTSSR